MNVIRSSIYVTYAAFILTGKLALCQTSPIGTLPVPATPPTPVPNTFTPIQPGYQRSAIHQHSFNNTINRGAFTEERRQASRELVEEALKEFEDDKRRYAVIPPARYSKTGPYWEALQKLKSMGQNLDVSFSLADAVFVVENAYFDNKLSSKTFKQLIDAKVDLCKYIMKKEHLDSANAIAKHYAIQKLYSESITQNNNKTKISRTYSPFKYDFEDFMGHERWDNMFVSKLLFTGKGQCHSMPLTYLILAERLGTNAYLSLAPEHSYIRFFDNKGTAYNFETTNGILVSDKWLMRSGYINANAVKNRTYLDTLNRRQLLGYMLVDLALGYMSKFGYGNFVDQTLGMVEELYPDNLQALLIKANLATRTAMYAIKSAGSPPPDQLPKYPEAYRRYQEMHAIYRKIDDLGYQRMPEEEYQKWLGSLKDARQKQEGQEISNLLKNNMEIKININNKQN